MENVLSSQVSIYVPSMFGSSLSEVMELQQDRFPERRLPWIQTTLSEEILRVNGVATEGIFRLSSVPLVFGSSYSLPFVTVTSVQLSWKPYLFVLEAGSTCLCYMHIRYVVWSYFMDPSASQLSCRMTDEPCVIDYSFSSLSSVVSLSVKHCTIQSNPSIHPLTLA